MKILSFLSVIFSRSVRFLKGLGTRRKWVAAVVGILLIGGVGYIFFGPKTVRDDAPIEEKDASVELIAISDYAQGSRNSTRVAGSESVVRAETSGKIVRVLPVGTRVSSGTIIAQFENASQRATLLQAEGSLDAARASLEKTQGGPRSEKIAVLEASFESAQSSAVTTLLSAYSSVDTAVRDTADQMFSNPESASPSLSFTSSNQQRRIDAENQRVLLGEVLSRQSQASLNISNSSNFESELASTESEVRQARIFIDTLISALNEAIATNGVSESQIATYKTTATAARTSLTTSLSSIASARASLETAKQNLDEGLTGAENTDLAAASASVKQAQGSYDAALATYEKTIVRAPSSGTIVSCSASVGDVISVGNDVCRVRSAVPASLGDVFVLPLSSVKYTPTGAFVFVVTGDETLEALPVTTGLVVADGITTTGLLGDEFIVKDVRGLKAGEVVQISN